MQLWRAHYTTTPLGKIHRHVVDVLTIYPYHSVNSMDTWYLVFSMMLVLYLVSPGPLASVYIFYRFVFSLSFYRYRYRYAEIVGTVFLIVSFPNDNTETFGTISTTNVHILRFSTPFLIFSCPLFWLSLYSFCSNHSILIQTGVHIPMLSGVGNDTHQTTSQSGPTAVGAEGPFLP